MLFDTLGAAKLPITIHSGEGSLLWDTHGRTYWDFYGGHAVTLLGQGHKGWTSAIQRQLTQLSFCTTIAAVAVRTQAAAALCAFTQMDQAWFVNSGAEANEGALKLARKATGRPVIIAMENGFHGRTMGALGVTDHYRNQHHPVHGDCRLVPFGDLAALEAALGPDVAAVITEPIQGVAGVVEPPAGWLAGVRRLTTKAGALLIADEVQSGMGRTGVPLASHREGVQPDIVTLGKSLGNGFPVAAVLMQDAVAATASPGEHGTTFGGGPLACVAVDATLKAIETEDLLQRATALGAHAKRLLSALPGVEVRGHGAWLGAVLPTPAKPVAAALRERGFLVGTARDPHVLRLSPAANCPLSAVNLLTEALAEVLSTLALEEVA